MANITFNIPDANLPRVTNSLALYYGYNAATDGVKAVFVKAKIAAVLTSIIKQAEREDAISASAIAADAFYQDPQIT